MVAHDIRINTLGERVRQVIRSRNTGGNDGVVSLLPASIEVPKLNVLGYSFCRFLLSEVTSAGSGHADLSMSLAVLHGVDAG